MVPLIVRIFDDEDDDDAMNQKPDSDSSFPMSARGWVDKGIYEFPPNVIAERKDTCAGNLVFSRRAQHAEVV